MGPIALNEVKNTIHKLKIDYAPGEDGVCPEMLKVEGKETPYILQRILQDIRIKEDIPYDWKKGVIIKLHKKGDLRDCSNWRGIALLFLTSKVFSRIILERFTTAVEDIPRQEQAEFRMGKY